MVKDEYLQIKTTVSKLKIKNIQEFDDETKYDKIFCCSCKAWLLFAENQGITPKNRGYPLIVDTI